MTNFWFPKVSMFGIRAQPVAAGLSVPRLGLFTAAYLYGAAIILLALMPMMAWLWMER